WIFFFFQAEDGIRYRNVTGVQTCALPISKELERFEGELDQSSKAQEDLKQEVTILNRTLEATRGFREMLAMERPSPEDPEYQEFLEYSKTQENEQIALEVVYMGSVGVDSGKLMITDPAYVDS